MTFRLIIEPEAEADIQSAAHWYQEQRTGLGVEFVFAVEATLAQIRRRPESILLVYRNLRRALVRRFPYGVLFIVDGRVVHVIAVFHAKRNPALWKRRGRKRR